MFECGWLTECPILPQNPGDSDMLSINLKTEQPHWDSLGCSRFLKALSLGIFHFGHLYYIESKL